MRADMTSVLQKITPKRGGQQAFNFLDEGELTLPA